MICLVADGTESCNKRKFGFLTMWVCGLGKMSAKVFFQWAYALMPHFKKDVVGMLMPKLRKRCRLLVLLHNVW